MKEKVSAKIGQKIRTIRQTKNLKLSAIARIIGIAKSYLSDIENGKRKITPDVEEIIVKMLKAMKVSEEEIFALLVEASLSRINIADEHKKILLKYYKEEVLKKK